MQSQMTQIMFTYQKDGSNDDKKNTEDHDKFSFIVQAFWTMIP